MTEQLGCNVVTECDIEGDMNAEDIRNYRTKLGLSVQDFLFDLFKVTGERFSLGHFTQVENKKRAVTSRLRGAIKAYKESKK